MRAKFTAFACSTGLETEEELEIIFKIHLYHNLLERLIITSIFFIIGVVWDTFAITQGHWFFPQDKILGITIGVMPLEEYLFILIIPYSVLTVYKIIDSKFIKKRDT